MFNAIAGTYLTDEGRIILDGKDITSLPEHKRARFIGRLFQDPMKGSAQGMSIEENLALAAGSGGWLSHISKADKERFREQLALLDIGLENRMSQPFGNSLVKGNPQPPPVESPTIRTLSRYFIIDTKLLVALYDERLVSFTIGLM